MKKSELLNEWYAEEKEAYIQGWDFSHIDGRYQQEELPWDYKAIVHQYLQSDMRLLDIDTGGGEFLLSFHHPYHLTAATENYAPNVELCKNKLIPLGIDFKQADGNSEKLPFADRSFDIIINRHGSFCAKAIKKLLKPGGIFITQQVGAKNDRELVELLYENEMALPYPKQFLQYTREEFEKAGFQIIQAEEAYSFIKFFDVGALVWFAHIIEWEFPKFSVDYCLKGLYKAQELLESKGMIEGHIHRYFIVARG